MEPNKNSKIIYRDTNDIGPGITKIRKEKHLTQIQLAERAGIDQSSLSRIELQQKGLRLETLNNIAKAMSVTMQDIQDAADNLTPTVRELRSRVSTLTDEQADEILRIMDITIKD